MKKEILAIIKPDISKIVENIARSSNKNCDICQQKITDAINKVIDRKIVITVIVVDIIINLILRGGV